jgi:integrase
MSDTDLLTDEIAALTSPITNLSEIMVSKRSHVYDLIWDFTEDLAHRPRTVGDIKLRVDWTAYIFAPLLRQEMQCIFCLYYKAPKMISRRGKLKPNTLCMNVKRCLDFLNDAIRRFPLPNMVESLTQLEMSDLKDAAATHRGRSHRQIKLGLNILFSGQAGKAVGKSFQINQQDIKSLEFKIESHSAQQEVSNRPAYLPDALFTFLSDAATARVHEFLERLDLKPEDVCTYEYDPPKEIECIEDFTQAFEVYEKWRRQQKGVPISDEHEPENRLRAALKSQNARMGAMQGYLAQVNTAAVCVIAMYIGARFSELASLQVGCLTERDGVACLVGREFKSKADNNLSDDAWVAIPAVRDAVRALEQLARIKNKKYLISSLETAKGTGLRGTGLSYQSVGFTNSLKLFLTAIDTEGHFKNWQFNSHQFKHSLARQMIKAKLGLPYISFHLKHLHSRTVSLPSDVTLAYGNAASLIQSQSAGYHLDDIRRDITRKLYDPESPVYGGAAKEFNDRRKAYFEGMAGAGITKEEIIGSLADSATPLFVNVGLGYCTGRRDNPATGEKPPCIGSLRCNPNRCANAIITKEVHGPAWRKVYLENKKMAGDPRFAYAKAELEAAANEAKDVLHRLDEDI